MHRVACIFPSIGAKHVIVASHDADGVMTYMSTCAHLFIPTSCHICIACTYAMRSYTYLMIKAAAASTKLVRSKVSPKPKKRKKRKGRESRRLYLVGAKLELPRHERSRLGTRRAVRIADHSPSKTHQSMGGFIVHVYMAYSHRFQ